MEGWFEAAISINFTTDFPSLELSDLRSKSTFAIRGGGGGVWGYDGIALFYS